MTPSDTVREALDNHLPTFSSVERADYYRNIMSTFDSIVRERKQLWDALREVLPSILRYEVLCPHGFTVDERCSQDECSWDPVRKAFLEIYT